MDKLKLHYLNFGLYIQAHYKEINICKHKLSIKVAVPTCPGAAQGVTTVNKVVKLSAVLIQLKPHQQQQRTMPSQPVMDIWQNTFMKIKLSI